MTVVCHGFSGLAGGGLCGMSGRLRNAAQEGLAEVREPLDKQELMIYAGKMIPVTAPPITRIALYVRDMCRIADFYSKHFGFIRDFSEMPALLSLSSPSGGCDLILLQASKGHKIGQSCIKIVFDVKDIEAYKTSCLGDGLEFGPTHQCDGYAYSNARDPARNLIQISSRAFRK